MAQHQWRIEPSTGQPAYLELSPPEDVIQHGGPFCEICEEAYCQHEPEFDWNAQCPGPAE